MCGSGVEAANRHSVVASSRVQTKVRDERQVVGGDEREAAPVEREPFERERGVVVDVVEVYERERAGVCAPRAKMSAHVCAS